MALGGINTMLVVFTGPKIASDPHGFTEANVTLGTSLFYLGWALSSAFIMPLSDTVGRKPILSLLNTVGLMSVACGLAATGPWLYLMSWFGMGFFASAAILGFTLCMELLPERYRTTATCGINCLFSLGVIAIALTSTYLTPGWSWRRETAAWYLPNLFLTIVGPFVLKESPAFRRDVEIPVVALPAVSGQSRGGLSERPPNPMQGLKWRMVTTCFCWSACVVGYYGLSYSAGNLSDDLCLNIVLLNLVDVVSYVFAMPVVTTLGGKKTQEWCFAGAGLVLCSLSFAQTGSRWVLVGVLCGRWFINLDFVTVFLLLMEHFPTECRSTAFGLANLTSRLAGMAAPVCALVPAHTTFRCIGSLTAMASIATRALPDPPQKD